MLWYHIQRAVIINQLIGAVLTLTLFALGYPLYACYVLVEMVVAFMIWWKVMVD